MVCPFVHRVHHDPSVHANPGQFAPERFVGRTYRSSEFLPFGLGRRYCLGAATGQRLMDRVLERLLDRRLEFRLRDGSFRPIRRNVTIWPRGIPVRPASAGRRGVGMTTSLSIAVLIYLHVISLSLWFGGLFGYVVIVWPALMSGADGEFPRAILASIAMRTAPWIYLAMSTALVSLAGIWVMDGVAAQTPWMVGYSLLLAALVANNVYGTVVAWPRLMLLPRSIAGREWLWFRVRMSVSLVVGLALYSVAIIAT